MLNVSLERASGEEKLKKSVCVCLMGMGNWLVDGGKDLKVIGNGIQGVGREVGLK